MKLITTLRSVRSLMLSTLLLLIAHGLQLTLLPLTAQSLGWSTGAIAATGSAYYVGFLLGCIYQPGLVLRVGHIRTFCVCIAVSINVILLAPQWLNLPAWIVLRLLSGACLAGLYLVIESWLNERAPDAIRGLIMAVYGAISLLAMGIGQLVYVTGQSDNGDTLLFTLTAGLLSLALIPVALTRSHQPIPLPDVRVQWRKVFGASQVGPPCAMLAGMALGIMWSSGAVYASELTGSPQTGARLIAAMTLGGLALNLPAGRLSDHFDRRWVLFGLAVMGVAAAALWRTLPVAVEWQLYIAAFGVGAAGLPMYSLAVAHANDNSGGNFLEIAGTLLIANAIGAAFAPLLLPLFTAVGISDSLFPLVAACFAAAAAWTLWRTSTHPVVRDHFEPFEVLPRTTQGAASIDPRGAEHAPAAQHSVGS